MATTIIREQVTETKVVAPSTPKVAQAKNNNKNNKNNTNNKNKRTFMLHSVDDMSALGRFTSTDWRYAALKAASRNHRTIILRQTGTREVREFEGSRVEIEPKIIERGGRTITYTHRPQVKFIKKFFYAGEIDENAPVANDPVANAPST
jgi:hypothetical protein